MAEVMSDQEYIERLEARVAELEGELADLLGATARTPGINYWRQKASAALAAEGKGNTPCT